MIGSKIVDVRPMTDEEVENEGWMEGGPAIVLSNGDVIYASMDHEGNGAGAIFGMRKDGTGFALA